MWSTPKAGGGFSEFESLPPRSHGPGLGIHNIGPVEGQAFFTTVAGISVSLAGFGAVIAWLRDDLSGWDPVNLWRVKTIVRHALTIAFLCLALVPIYTFTKNDAMTIRIASGLVSVFAISDVWRVRHPDPTVWDPVSLRVFVTSTGSIAAFGLANILWASLGLLQVLVLVLLTSPAGIFSNFMREMGRSGPEAEAESGT